MKQYLTFILLSFSLPFHLYSQGDCEISNVTVTPHSCVNGMFLVEVDFDIVNPEGDVFGIVGNATNYGFFMYEDLPVELGPLPGDGETEWQFIIYDLGEPNCQSTYILGTYDCCTISDVVIDQIMCTGTSTFKARVNLSQSNTDSIGFQVYSETGALLGAFLYTDVPVIVDNIPSFRIGTTHLTICDLGSTSCCAVVEFQDPDCNKTDCEIYNLSVDTLGCDNGDFSVILDFDHMLGGSNFTVTGNGTDYGTFPYSALPLTIGPLSGDSITDYAFMVTGAGTGNHCSASFEIGTVSCPPGCGFDDVVIETMECRGDDAYSLLIAFAPISPGEQGFSVYAQGTLLGMFSYDDVPVMIDSFPATGNFYDELELCDNADSTCCYTYEFRALLCCCCVINNLTMTPTVCDTNNQFNVEIDFYHYNVGDNGFQVGGTGGIMGPFSYDSLPIVLGPFNGDSMTYYEFLVYDLLDGFCFNGGELGIVDCDCGFDSISVDTLACTGNGMYSLLLDFTPVDVTNESFDVYAGSAFLGTYLYANLPVVVPEFPSSGNPFDVITVCDHNSPTCCATYEFVGKNCVCEIFEIVAQTSTCDTMTTTFDLFLDFQWEGIAQEFTVYLGNDSVGTIQGANLPDTLVGLSTNIGTSLLTICGNGHPDCCNSIEIENPCQGPCQINGLTVDISPCDSITNTFYMTVDFEWIGDYEEFEIFMDDVLLDSVAGVNLPDTIFDLTTLGDTVLISVSAKNRPDCIAYVELVLEECRTIPCDIFDLVAIPGTCTGHSSFAMVLDFIYQGFTQDSVDIWASGTYIGAYTVDSLPIHINTFPWNGMDTMSVQICQRGDPECCETIAFAAPFCGCEIQSIAAETLGYCNPDSATFPVVLDVHWRGDVSAFTVYADTVLLAVIGPGYLPDTVFNFPIPVGEFAEVTICGNDNPTCCATVSFLAPVCDLCEISILTVDTFQCTGPSTFSAWVEYETEGVDGPLQFWADDVYLGEYQQFHPLLLINIPESDSAIVLSACSSLNPACCAETEFQGMHCPDDPCVISDITAMVSAQDTAGAFSVTLDFDFDNVGAAFTISGNGNQYGVFTYNNVPVTLNMLQCDSTTSWEFVVQDLQNIGCYAIADIGLVACDTTTGVFRDPAQILPLEIFYGKTGPSLIVPDGAEEFVMWTYDGRLIARESNLDAGERLFVSGYVKMPGFYLLQIRCADRIYVGKVVGLY